MKTDDLIPVEVFCTSYEVDQSFIDALSESGLIELHYIEDSGYLPVERITDIEKMIRLHFDLEINIPGIQAVSQLLNQISQMQERMRNLEARLKLYES